VDGVQVKEGDIVRPPANAANVTVDQLKVKRIVIVDKQPSPFRNGYWDVDIKFVFEYRITFRESDASVIARVKANNIFNMKVTMYGSIGSELVMGTDLFKAFNETTTFDAEPFILVEAQAVALQAKLHYPHHNENCKDNTEAAEPNRVLVTIGLFYIIKLFRIVNLLVNSKGFCMPDKCDDCQPICPCEYFEELDFPVDIFAPPGKAG